jgi:hypothetical protein
MAQGSTQPLTEMSTRGISWGERGVEMAYSSDLWIISSAWSQN